MGFDLYGMSPKTSKGDYFRNNVWCWRPLWDFISETCKDILTEEDIEFGGSNSGHEIDADKAKRIYTRVQGLSHAMVADEINYIDHYIKDRNEHIKSLPEEPCLLCDSTGWRRRPPNKGKGDMKALTQWYVELIRGLEGGRIPFLWGQSPDTKHMLFKMDSFDGPDTNWSSIIKANEIPEIVKGKYLDCSPCNGCGGKKFKKPWACSYPLDKQNILEFAEFCKDSGGFTIS